MSKRSLSFLFDLKTNKNDNKISYFNKINKQSIVIILCLYFLIKV